MSVKVRYARLRIIRNETTTINETVPAWEVPIVQAVHEQVVVEGEETRELAVLPDPTEEFQRLDNRYKGGKTESGDILPSVVTAVYGFGALGASRFAQEVQNSVLVEEPAADLIGETDTAAA